MQSLLFLSPRRALSSSSRSRCGFAARAPRDRDELLSALRGDAKSGDCVLLMGARDPSLPALGKKIVSLFGGELIG